MANWKSIGIGVAAATVGAAAFGAVHYMFLAPQFGVGDFFGIPLAVILPVALGVLGFLVPALLKMKEGMIKDVIHYGGAAAIGFGIAQYAGWITPTATARARAYTPAMTYAPRQSYAPASASYGGSGGSVKII